MKERANLSRNRILTVPSIRSEVKDKTIRDVGVKQQEAANFGTLCDEEYSRRFGRLATPLHGVGMGAPNVPVRRVLLLRHW